MIINDIKSVIHVDELCLTMLNTYNLAAVTSVTCHMCILKKYSRYFAMKIIFACNLED